MDEHEPRFCPRCGRDDLSVMGLLNDDNTPFGYDVYCNDCEWSGDISPDALN